MRINRFMCKSFFQYRIWNRRNYQHDPITLQLGEEETCQVSSTVHCHMQKISQQTKTIATKFNELCKWQSFQLLDDYNATELQSLQPDVTRINWFTCIANHSSNTVNSFTSPLSTWPKHIASKSGRDLVSSKTSNWSKANHTRPWKPNNFHSLFLGPPACLTSPVDWVSTDWDQC